MEVPIDKQRDLALGSGTLGVTDDSATVTINSDSQWRAEQIDIGSELYIDGGYHIIAEVINPTTVKLSQVYRGPSKPKARYVAGSVRIGGTSEVVDQLNA